MPTRLAPNIFGSILYFADIHKSEKTWISTTLCNILLAQFEQISSTDFFIIIYKYLKQSNVQYSEYLFNIRDSALILDPYLNVRNIFNNEHVDRFAQKLRFSSFLISYTEAHAQTALMHTLIKTKRGQTKYYENEIHVHFAKILFSQVVVTNISCCGNQFITIKKINQCLIKFNSQSHTKP